MAWRCYVESLHVQMQNGNTFQMFNIICDFQITDFKIYYFIRGYIFIANLKCQCFIRHTF